MIYIVYCVVDLDVADDWETWMEKIHIPEVLETGCFSSCVMTRDEDADTDSARGFRMIYQLPSLRVFEHYQSEFAPALKADHSERYAGRVSARRDVLPVVAFFDGDDYAN